MTTDPHETGSGNLPEHGDVSFEARDISISSVLWSLVYLALTVFISLIICWYFFKFTTQYVASQEKPRPMIRQQMSSEDEQRMAMPTEPRLQGVPGHESDAQQDMRDKIASDTTANESYRWVDNRKTRRRRNSSRCAFATNLESLSRCSSQRRRLVHR